MRSSIILSSLLASVSLVLAVPQFGGSFDTSMGNVTCGETCHTFIDQGCAKDDPVCTCKPDFNIQVPFIKCLYDDCPVNVAGFSYVLYSGACGLQLEAAASKTSTSTSTSTSATAIPTTIVANAFTVPCKLLVIPVHDLVRVTTVCSDCATIACAAKCVSKETFPRCEKGDPACVCPNSASTSSLSEDEKHEEEGHMVKCIVDSCSTQDAAVALTVFTIDCG
jgi:hypothetical protein